MPSERAAASHFGISVAGTRQDVGPRFSAAATARATYVLPLPTGSANTAPRYLRTAASVRRKLGSCASSSHGGAGESSSDGARLLASEAATEAPEAIGPTLRAVRSGSGTAVSASATMAGGAVHHGTKCMLGGRGKGEVTRHDFVQLLLNLGSRPGLPGKARQHRVGRCGEWKGKE